MITILQLSGMRTVHCVRAVRTALAAIDGIDGAEVVLGEVRLDHANPLDPAGLRAAIEPTGYSITAIESAARVLRVL